MKPTSKPTDTTPRVIRGGGWSNFDPSWVRAASRSTFEPALRYDFLGFRTHLPVRIPRV